MSYVACNVSCRASSSPLTCRSCLRTTRALRLMWSRRPRSIPRRCTHPLARSSRGLLREIGCAAGRCGLCTRQAARRLHAWQCWTTWGGADASCTGHCERLLSFAYPSWVCRRARRSRHGSCSAASTWKVRPSRSRNATDARRSRSRSVPRRCTVGWALMELTVRAEADTCPHLRLD